MIAKRIPELRRLSPEEKLILVGELWEELAAPPAREVHMGTVAERIPELKRLSQEEKLILVGEFWEELAAGPDAFLEREDHIQLLKARLNHSRQHPKNTAT
jgi:hypothetical protein